MMNHFRLAVILLVVFALVTACAPNIPAAPGQNNSNPVVAITEVPSAAPTQAAPAQAADTPTVEQPAAPAAADGASFVLFDREAAMLRVYSIDGTLRFEGPTPGLQYPTENTLSIVKDAVYYATDGMDKAIYRVSAAGTQEMGISVGKMQAFKVSPDEQWIAWSVLNMDPSQSTSQLWVKSLTSGAKDAQQVASYSRETHKYFSLMPLEWSADSSSLLFERAGVGLGGYILYGSHFSLYSYELSSGQIKTIVAAEEERGTCLNSLDAFRLDLNKVTFLCGNDIQAAQQVTVRDLASEQNSAVPMLPEQRVAGSSHFSPSGQWLAYATARGNPEDEAGQVAVAPSDLSAAPVVIFKVAQQRYPTVQGWLDDDTLLVTITNFSGPRNTIMTIRRDGTDAREIGSGEFVGWVR